MIQPAMSKGLLVELDDEQVTVVTHRLAGDGWFCVVVASRNPDNPVGGYDMWVDRGQLETGRRVDFDEQRKRLDAVLALHEDGGDGYCDSCGDVPQVRHPCDTVLATRGET